MAELDVVRKKKSIWPWILVALLVLAAILYFVLRDNTADNAVAPATTDTTLQTDTSGVPRQ